MKWSCGEANRWTGLLIRHQFNPSRSQRGKNDLQLRGSVKQQALQHFLESYFQPDKRKLQKNFQIWWVCERARNKTNQSRKPWHGGKQSGNFCCSSKQSISTRSKRNRQKATLMAMKFSMKAAKIQRVTHPFCFENGHSLWRFIQPGRVVFAKKNFIDCKSIYRLSSNQSRPERIKKSTFT